MRTMHVTFSDATNTRGRSDSIPVQAATGSAQMTPHMRSARQLSAPGRLPGIARLAIALEVFLGLGALFGGGALILAPDGDLLGMPTKVLAGSPFSSFLVPGIILFTLVGLAPVLAAAVTARRQAFAPFAAVAVGLTLIGWVSVEMVVLAGLGSLAWAFYLVLGACIAAIGVAWWRSSPRSVKHLESR
jgi:hypothetical protein